MKCWHCRSELVWGSDADYDDVGLEGDGIVSFLNCSKCPTNIEVYHTIKPVDE